MARILTSFVLAGYLVAALWPCPVPGSAEASAQRADLSRNGANEIVESASRAEPTEQAHAHHEHHDHHAVAAPADEHAGHQMEPAPNAIDFALTLPCPCGCGDKARGAAPGDKLGPRVPAAVSELPAFAVAVGCVDVFLAFESRDLSPAEAIPILDSSLIS